jgi:hypothetical protein
MLLMRRERVNDFSGFSGICGEFKTKRQYGLRAAASRLS